MRSFVKINGFLLGISCLIIQGCMLNDNSSTAEDMTDYITSPKNNLSETVTVNGLNLKVQFEPVDFLIYKERSDEIKVAEDLESLRSAYTELEYYNFEILADNKSTREYLSTLFIDTELDFINYLDFSIQGDIYLVQGLDSVACSYLHREISDAITNKIHYLIGFSSNEIKKSDRNIYIKSRFKEVPDLSFIVSNEQIESMPHLKIK